MTEMLIISNVLAWVMIIALSVALFALARQIGVMHERINPVGALSLGSTLEVGASAPMFELASLTGGSTLVGGKSRDAKSTLLFFVSATCPICKELIPMLKKIQSQERGWLNLVFSSDGDPSEHEGVIAQHGLQHYPYLVTPELGMAYRIGKLPYGVLIDEKGVVASHGLINSREHLESLFAAKEMAA